MNKNIESAAEEKGLKSRKLGQNFFYPLRNIETNGTFPLKAKAICYQMQV